MNRCHVFTTHLLLRTRSAVIAVWCLGALSTDAAVSDRPDDGIFDDTHAFTDERRARLAEHLTEVRGKTGCDVWLLATTFLQPDRDIRAQAHQTRRTWSRANDAILLASERASGRHVVSISPGLWEKHPADGLVRLIQAGSQALNEKDKPLDERLDRALRIMTAHLDKLESQRRLREQPLQPADVRMVWYYLPATAVLAALGFLTGVCTRRQHGRQQPVLLPDVDVGQRFGASYGGLIVDSRLTWVG